MPVPVGSPPWITKPGTMRWKTVPSKKPDSTSEANDAAVFGAYLWLSRKLNSPQLVCITTT